MNTPSPDSESAAARRFAAERDRVEFSPAQPTGPDRIDDDDAAAPAVETLPPHVKTERAGHMEH
jgi:hypothetical protein